MKTLWKQGENTLDFTTFSYPKMSLKSACNNSIVLYNKEWCFTLLLTALMLYNKEWRFTLLLTALMFYNKEWCFTFLLTVPLFYNKEWCFLYFAFNSSYVLKFFKVSSRNMDFTAIGIYSVFYTYARDLKLLQPQFDEHGLYLV